MAVGLPFIFVLLTLGSFSANAKRRNVKNRLSHLENRLLMIEERLGLCESKHHTISENMESFNSSIVYLTQKLSGKHVIQANNGTNDIIARPLSCKEIYDDDNSTESGVYIVYPATQGAPVRVYCDMETDGGGWTVFQRRQDGSVGFYRKWRGYELGFGKLEGEFWLGNKHINEMTYGCCYELRVELEDFEGNTAYAKYGTFRVLSQAENYKLVVGKYSGNATDSLTIHSGWPFTTRDRDNDNFGKNCAEQFKGGWWYNECYYSNLNGRYFYGDKISSYRGINWNKLPDMQANSLKMTEMKFRKT